MEGGEQLLINYIENFEKSYVKDIFNNYKKKNPYKGYLINLENYEELKNELKAQSNAKSNGPKILESKTRLKTLEINNSQYLIKMLFNKNDYIIINEELWDLFGERENDNSHILYYIDKDFIIFSLADNIKLKFICWDHNNIISRFSIEEKSNKDYYSKLKTYFGKIDKITIKLLIIINLKKN